MKLASPLGAAGAAALLLAACVAPQRVDVPAAIATTAHEQLARTVAARGVQIYECRAGGAAGAAEQPGWVLVAPDAQLFDSAGRVVGHHGAGPQWTFNDGLRVSASLKSRADAPSANAVAWLLLSTAPGSAGGMSSVQRIHTRGGVAPAEGCTGDGAGLRVRVPYSADYLFYSSR